VGVFVPASPGDLTHSAGTRFRPTGDPLPAEDARLFQGFLEQSNVNPVAEITRMIGVQRAYELGQAFLDREDARIRAVIQATAR
jgi:flagellar basal-body rod protein FlgF